MASGNAPAPCPAPDLWGGIEIGGTKLQMVIGRPGAIEARHRLQVRPAEGGEGIRRQLAGLLPGLCQRHAVRAIGVGFGGPVDWRTGIIRCSHQITGWADFPLVDWLRQTTGCPVQVDNDANVAALGEALFGAGRQMNPVFYVTLGSGVGGGLVAQGHIYHGASPGEAEIGHVRLDRQGTTLEQRCSGWAVDARIRHLRQQGLSATWQALLDQQPGQGGEARTLGPALAAGAPEARRLLEEIADDLAFGLSHAVHLFHPQVIVLGGGLSLVGESLRAAVAARLPAYVMEAFLPAPQVSLAALGEDAVPMGALALAAATPACASPCPVV